MWGASPGWAADAVSAGGWGTGEAAPPAALLLPPHAAPRAALPRLAPPLAAVERERERGKEEREGGGEGVGTLGRRKWRRWPPSLGGAWRAGCGAGGGASGGGAAVAGLLPPPPVSLSYQGVASGGSW